jgi:hypothetical protein
MKKITVKVNDDGSRHLPAVIPKGYHDDRRDKIILGLNELAPFAEARWKGSRVYTTKGLWERHNIYNWSEYLPQYYIHMYYGEPRLYDRGAGEKTCLGKIADLLEGEELDQFIENFEKIKQVLNIA